MRNQFAFYLLFLNAIFFSCQNSVNEKKAFPEIFKKENVSGVFALYDYTNERLQVSAINEYKDSFYAAENFSYFLATLLLLEKGIVFNTENKYAFNKNKKSLRLAFEEKDVLFFQNALALINKQDIAQTLQKNNLKLTEGLSSNFKMCNDLKLSLDQMLGFISKFYYKKTSFQNRTIDLAKALFFEDGLNQTAHYISFQLVQSKQNAFIGWVEKNNRPHFFILSLKQTQFISEEKKRKVLYLLLQTTL